DVALRRAADAVRSEPRPEEALRRSLDRAGKIAVPRKGRLRYFNQWLLTVSGLAAALLLGGVYWMGRPQQNGSSGPAETQVAVTLEKLSDRMPTRRSTVVGSKDEYATAPGDEPAIRPPEPAKP